MTTPFDPSPRPALRKAADADIHPTTHVPASSFSSASTGDAVIAGKEVELTIHIPKKLRKQLKKAARESGLTVDQFAAIAINGEIQRRV